MIPYGKQSIGEEDIRSVEEVLRSDWLTTGPKVPEFEKAVAEYCGARHAVALSNGTAALHAAMFALGIGPGDEVIVPAITFVASSNCVVYQGGVPVFADVDPATLLVDPASVEEKITPRTRAILAVDFAGQPCEYGALRQMAERRGLGFVCDACHALGASWEGNPVGSLADLSTFSFHPVKPVTTGEGGMVVTSDETLALRMRIFRNHGIATDFRQRESNGTWEYEMISLGFNYRLPDLACALGLAQLAKLPGWIARRNEIAEAYDLAFREVAGVRPLERLPGRTHGFHLYVVRLSFDRGAAYRALRARGIGVNVHYKPVYLHPYYRGRFGTGPGLCPRAEEVWPTILSLPVFPQMSDRQLEEVIAAVRQTAGELA